MNRHKTRTLAALCATLALVLSACGSRLDHEVIARAGTGAGSGGEYGADGALLGEDGAPGAADGAVDGQPGAPGTGEAGGVSGKPAGSSGSTTDPRTGKGPGSGPGAANGAPIVIGSVGTYSGPVGVAYKDSPRALQAWAAATNAKGGIGGRPVKVIVYDDGGDAGKALSYVKSLAEQHKAVAMVASQTTAQNMRSWLKYVESQKFPVIAECGSVAHSSPMVFSPCPTLADAAFGTALIGAKHGKSKKFGALFCTESDDCSFVDDRWFAKGEAKRAGLEPLYRAKVSITQPDFTSECIQARNAGVELFAVIGDANTVGRVASSCRRQSYSPQFLQPDVTIGPDIPAKPGLGNVLAATRVFPFAGLSTPAATEFAATWKKYGGGTAPGGSASIGWAASKIFEKAARGAGKDVSRAGLLKQLYGVSNDRFGGLTVPLTFSAGKAPQPAKCMFIMQGSGGRWAAPQGDKPICF